MQKQNSAIAIAILVTIIICWFFGCMNHLASLKEDVDLQQAQVQTTLQRRSDLIPNLVETVQGYIDHEEAVFTAISEARTQLIESLDSGDLQSMNESNEALNLAINNLLALSENYPDLEASEQFIGLRDELAGTENRITVARQYYNEAVSTYNKAVRSFPTRILAVMTGYSPLEYFEADEGATQAPVVVFD